MMQFTQINVMRVLMLILTAVALTACKIGMRPAEHTQIPLGVSPATGVPVEIVTSEPISPTAVPTQPTATSQPTHTPTAVAAPSPTVPSPTPLPLEDLLDVTRWKTYTNEQLRFSIQHPPDWTTFYRDGFAYLDSIERFGEGPHPIAYGVNIMELPNAALRPFEEVVTEDLSSELQNIFTYEKVDFNGYTTYWTQHIPSMEGALTVFFDDDIRYLAVQFHPYRVDNAFGGQEKYWSVFEAMLQTIELHHS